MSTQFQKDWQLFLAARAGDLAAGREALAAGAAPNFVEPQNRKWPTTKHSSTLLRAVTYGHKDFTEMLFDAGAVMPAPALDQKQLCYEACRSSDPGLMLLLLQRGLTPTRQIADWAEKNGHREVQGLVERTLGKFEIRYDIDELLTKPTHEFLVAFSEAVPAHNNVHDPLLFPEERVVRDLWDLCCILGNQFSAVISNEMFDTLAASHQALTAIRPSNALRAVCEVREVLSKHGIPLDPREALRQRSNFPEETWDAMIEDIEAVDRRFFSGGPDDLWKNPEYLDYAMEYARSHVEILRQRK